MCETSIFVAHNTRRAWGCPYSDMGTEYGHPHDLLML